ncbi:hypothetical protein TARUN_10014 [Trichoderma arundinaceum]|uniref:Uncharacterized protein n=1 Tax=Trichoderma arundinaceum TaxID=490622 RepID=A0A395N8N8_TRIAR|nr:hypothetical protein TARUN_10014 [Trichoderma arundinaceum]
MDPNTEPQPRPDSGSTPPGHDFNIEDYTRLMRGRFSNAVYDSTSRPKKPIPPPPGDSNLDNTVQKASPDVTKGMGFAKENEPPPAPPPTITSEYGAHLNEPMGSDSS